MWDGNGTLPHAAYIASIMKKTTPRLRVSEFIKAKNPQGVEGPKTENQIQQRAKERL